MPQTHEGYKLKTPLVLRRELITGVYIHPDIPVLTKPLEWEAAKSGHLLQTLLNGLSLSCYPL